MHDFLLVTHEFACKGIWTYASSGDWNSLTFNFCKMVASIFDELTYREFSEIFDRGLEDTI